MFKFNPFLKLAFVLVMASLACNSPYSVTPDPNFIYTSVAQTLAVAQTETLPGIPVTGPTATPTFTASPTLTPTITLTPTPIFTATPLIPLISVSVPTNCRVGPGKVYDRIGALLVGEVTEIIGRNPSGNYWYVRNPDVNGGFCWLWGEYASLAGNISALPIFTPPPTPTPVPAFEVSYYGLESCNGSWWVEVKLENTGGIAFRSISLSVFDESSSTTHSMTNDNFVNNDGCNTSNSLDTLQTGSAVIVSAPAYSYDPTGRKIRTTVTLCSAEGVNGTCVTDVINFTP